MLALAQLSMAEVGRYEALLALNEGEYPRAAACIREAVVCLLTAQQALDGKTYEVIEHGRQPGHHPERDS
jgi:hypothetical protein